MTRTDYFLTSLEHILAEIGRVDLLIRLQVDRARQTQKTYTEFQGLYISEEEVEALMAMPAGLPLWATAPISIQEAEVRTALDQVTTQISKRKVGSSQQGITLRLDELVQLFQLTEFDINSLLICLASELDLRYERLYAYLQDDVTKKRPSVDLVLNLLCLSFEDKLAKHQHFHPSATLFKNHLLHLLEDSSNQNSSLLNKHLKIDERTLSYLLGSNEVDSHLLPFVRYSLPETRLEDLLLPKDFKQRLALLTSKHGQMGKGLIFYFQGPYGIGKHSTAQALCRELNAGLLTVDGELLVNTDGVAFDEVVQLAFREALLQGAILYWTNFDALLSEGKRGWLEILVQMLEDQRNLIFLAGNTTWEPLDMLHDLPFVRVEFSHFEYTERFQLWTTCLNGGKSNSAGVDLRELANKFRFSGGQICDAAATARNLARWRDPENEIVHKNDLYTACRLQSNRKLDVLTQKIIPHYTWNDIILPNEQLEQLHEICNSVKHRAQVYDEWGFDRKLSLGKGLNVLFAGPTGTGKTMAAEIIANELSLDLYRIDLATVVSKYIGETEKNLARIFAEADTSNAILFFDEADALFGKRSEVKDAHDRYANIEISYLLQKMEAYEGIAILATNLRKNIDEAFARRMAFAVHFPFPEEGDRLRIWRRIWPPETPLADELDLTFMARQFKLSGGNIKNIALGAAFLAAESCQSISIDHLILATKREYQKMGKVCVAAEFGPYYELIVEKT